MRFPSLSAHCPAGRFLLCHFLKRPLFHLSILIFCTSSCFPLSAQNNSLWGKAKTLSEKFKVIEDPNETSENKKAAAKAFFEQLQGLYINGNQLDEAWINDQLKEYDHLERYINLSFSNLDLGKDEDEEKIRLKQEEITAKFGEADRIRQQFWEMTDVINFLKDDRDQRLIEIIRTVDDIDSSTMALEGVKDKLLRVGDTRTLITARTASEPETPKDRLLILFEEFVAFERFEELTAITPDEARGLNRTEVENAPRFKRLRDRFSAYIAFREISLFLENEWHQDCIDEADRGLITIRRQTDLEAALFDRPRSPLLRIWRTLKEVDCVSERVEAAFQPPEPPVTAGTTSTPLPTRIGTFFERQIRDLDQMRKDLKLAKINILELQGQLEDLKGTSSRNFNYNYAPIAMGLRSSSEMERAEQLIPTIVFRQEGSGSLQGSIIDGTSKWIAERMKEELNIAFFDRFERWLEGQNINQLFPNTYSSIKSSLTTDYELMIKIFKSAFEKDLNQMPFNLALFIASEFNYQYRLETLNDTIREMEKNLVLLDNLIRKQNQVLDELAVSPELDSYGSSYQTKGYAQTGIEWVGGDTPDRLQRAIADNNTKKEDLAKRLTEQKLEADNIRNNYRIMRYIEFTIKAVQALNEGQHPTTLLSSILGQEDQEVFADFDHLKTGLSVLHAFSQSLFAPQDQEDSQSVWIRGKELFQSLTADPDLQDLFFGLIHREVKSPIKAQSLLIANKIEEQRKMLDVLEREKGEAAFEAFFEGFSYFYIYSLNDYLTKGYLPDLLELEPAAADEQIQQLIDDYEANEYYEIPDEEEQIYLKVVSDLLAYARADSIRNLVSRAYPAQEQTVETGESETPYAPFAAVIEQYFKVEGEEMAELEDIEEFFRSIVLTIEDFYKNVGGYYGSQNPEELTRSFRAELEESIGTDPTIGDPILAAFDESVRIIKNQKEDESAPEDFYARLSASAEINGARDTLNELITTQIQQLWLDQRETYLQNLPPPNYESDPQIREWRFELSRIQDSGNFADSLLNRQSGRMQELFVNFVRYTDQIDFIRSELIQLQKLDKANFGSQEFIFFIRNSLEFLYQAYEIAVPKDEKGVVSIIKELTSSLLDAYASVLQKDYDAIVMNVLPIAQTLVEINYQNKIRDLKNLQGADKQLNRKIAGMLTDGILSDSELNGLKEDEKNKIRKIFSDANSGEREELTAILEDKKSKINKLHEIFKYGAFLAAVVESRDADAIKSAIQAIALPSGSYSIKRRTIKNISLNAFPGLTGGYELASNSKGEAWAPNFGFTAPIGLAYSWGYKSKIDGLRYYTDLAYQRRVERSVKFKGGSRFLGGHSGSLFFPLIDLGAIVLFRLDNTDEALPQDVGFQQIFSPGIMYGHGFPNVPVTLIGGVQVSPRLRTIEEEKANALRFNASLVVDLPMANFYTQSRHKKKRKR